MAYGESLVGGMQNALNFPNQGKLYRYVELALGFAGPGFAHNRRRLEPEEMKFPAVQQLPLHFFARLQADGRAQSQRKAHIQSGILSARAYRLNS